MINVTTFPCPDPDTNCTPTYINGVCLLIVGILGCALTFRAIFLLLTSSGSLLSPIQRLLLLNVEFEDAIMAVLGVIRGLGMIDPIFLGYDKNTGNSNEWCAVYTIIGSTFWICPLTVLLPLTIDRFFALILPMYHRTMFNETAAKMLMVLSWLPALVQLTVILVSYTVHDNYVVYQKDYHRCILHFRNDNLQLYFIIVPFFLILAMYSLIFISIFLNGIPCRKLLKFSSLIIGSSLLVNTANQLMLTFEIAMGYFASTWLTIILFYTGSIWNALIYIFSRGEGKNRLRNVRRKSRISDTSCQTEVHQIRPSVTLSMSSD